MDSFFTNCNETAVLLRLLLIYFKRYLFNICAMPGMVLDFTEIFTSDNSLQLVSYTRIPAYINLATII